MKEMKEMKEVKEMKEMKEMKEIKEMKEMKEMKEIKLQRSSDAFEREFNRLLEAQKQAATGQRLEMLCRDLSSTKQMLQVTVWPVLKSLESIILEFELVSRSGIKVYIDGLETRAGLALESEGFAVHAQNISRERFAFEKRKVRTIASYGYMYTPFSRDELEGKPDECQSSFAELIGRYAGYGWNQLYSELNVYEREVLRYGKRLLRPLKPADVQFCLGCGRTFGTKVLRSLLDKELLLPGGEGVHRFRQYLLAEKAFRLPL
ncbi:hypothetical protein [Cohnella caldifontis]|uniref:hypothetical protein n=1 Tax=Cohnella caldifontis TaxID=3027471 RepID=UPI0023ED1B6B|nr:hypothetical protein [Cohnella sp. YIM B05605]